MPNVHSCSLFSEYDRELFASGHHNQLYKKLGAHVMELAGKKGVYFATYAPAAQQVSIIGDFNDWNGNSHPLQVQWNGSGIWEGFIEGVHVDMLYKFYILSHNDDKVREKSDPFAFKTEMPPKSASVITQSTYIWNDQKWQQSEVQEKNSLDAPMLVYECHLGSWRKKHNGSESLSYRELATKLVEYVCEMGYTHVELMPVMEHPFYPSWGYLCTSYFAPSARYGNPEDLKYLIDAFHKKGIAVILDWVPAHFPNDESALVDFDGSAVYEHPDRQKGFHPDWNSLIFNYERPEIRSFLLSSAHYWIEEFHADGLRVDAVASMLYLDYSRKEGEWSPNEFGGNQYIAAIDFLKELNKSIYGRFPHIQMIAEESTAFPGVTRPVHEGGLGFGLKWMMGWMNDTLDYIEKDPVHRKYHQYDISRSLTYAFSENYVLPLSHDEVVHGKQSIVTKMPGDEWQRFANTRLLYFYMYTHPGQKLLFMGNDIGQTTEWDVDKGVEWHLLDHAPHQGLQHFVKRLNRFYTETEALYAFNYDNRGWQWIDFHDSDHSVLAYIRKGKSSQLVIVCNFTPSVLHDYRIGVPAASSYKEVFNSDSLAFFGSGVQNEHIIRVEKKSCHEFDQSIILTLPPLGGVILQKMEES